jgi:hypothetical protein
MRAIGFLGAVFLTSGTLVTAMHPADAQSQSPQTCLHYFDPSVPFGTPNHQIIATNGLCPDSARFPVRQLDIKLAGPAYRCLAAVGHKCWFRITSNRNPPTLFSLESGETRYDWSSVPGKDKYCDCVDGFPANSCRVSGYVCTDARTVTFRNKAP